MADWFHYDVFLSHSSKDKPAVRALAERLKADGLRVWLDDWEILAGDSIFQKVQQGLQQSRILLLFLSRQAFGSDWVTLEHQTILFRDPTNKERRFIPLRLDDTEHPDVLRPFAYIDWRKPTDVEYSRLLQLCRTPAAIQPTEGSDSSEAEQERPPAENAVHRAYSGELGACTRRAASMLGPLARRGIVLCVALAFIFTAAWGGYEGLRWAFGTNPP
jgi:hypothetical protein